jgi:hypothetical protein
LIREYTRTKSNPNGCALSNDVLSELAGELAEFDSGHALIARLVGEELARNNCNVSDVEKLISETRGKAEAFIILHINGLFKVDENPNTAKVLVEVFALRRPFVDEVGPGDPILTPGIVGLIGEERGARVLYGAVGKELRGWLAIRQHDLIEKAIKKLLDCIASENEECKDLSDALKPWKTIGVMETLREVSEKVRNENSAVEYFASNYGEKLTNTLKLFSNECWKRAAYIIGHALVGHPIVPRPEDLPSGVVESLGDVLGKCSVDDYLLVGDEIPPLIRRLIRNYARALAEAFIDKYDEAVVEVRRVRDAARGRGYIYVAEEFYGLGLASIIAKAVELNKDVESGGADAALYIVPFAIQYVVSAHLIMPILRALEPLRDKAPHRYIVLLALASNRTSLDLVAVGHILGELSEVLGSYSYEVKGRAWSLMYAIDAYAGLLMNYLGYFNREGVEGMVRKVADLLNELDKLSPSLGVIAWAYALDLALRHRIVRRLMEEKLGINVVNKASEVLEKLSKMRDEVQDLMGDKEFMGYVESRFVKANEKAVRRSILNTASFLRYALAIYRLDNDEFEEAAKLFNETAEEDREIGVYGDYLIARGWVLRIEAIKGSLVGDELVNGFRQLYEEAFNKERFSMPTARYLSIASARLGEYLVSLALTDNHETISKLLEEHWRVLNADRRVSVLTRLMLNALLGSKDRKDQLGSELKDKLVVESRKLIGAFRPRMYIKFLPALRVALGIVRPVDGYEECKSIEDSMKRRDCRGAVLAAADDSDAIWWLRWKLINGFHKRILENERSGWLRELSFNANAMISEFGKLVSGLDGKSLVRLIAPASSRASLALMLYALINGDERLARAHALIGIVEATGNKLLRRLFLEAYRACCDLESESFRRAIARLFFYHV